MDSLKGTLTPMKVLNGTLNGGIAYGTFNYNELENKPSVNGTELVGNVTIPIPTKTSDLSNDSGFITNADVPTKTSDLTNDSGFITSADIPTKQNNTSQLNNDSGFLTMNTTPVRSVNSQTGDVNLFIPNATSQLNNDAGFLTDNTVPVKSVNGQTGNIELTSDNIPYDGENSITEKVNEVVSDKADKTQLATTAFTNITPVTGVSIKVNKSHYITDKVVHLFVIFQTTANITNAKLCDISANDCAGMSFPIFCSSSQWGTYDTICYGYVGPSSIATTVTTAKPFLCIDIIIALS